MSLGDGAAMEAEERAIGLRFFTKAQREMRGEPLQVGDLLTDYETGDQYFATVTDIRIHEAMKRPKPLPAKTIIISNPTRMSK